MLLVKSCAPNFTYHVCIYCINPVLYISAANLKKKGKRALEVANLQNSSDLTDVVTKDNVSRANNA